MHYTWMFFIFDGINYQQKTLAPPPLSVAPPPPPPKRDIYSKLSFELFMRIISIGLTMGTHTSFIL